MTALHSRQSLGQARRLRSGVETIFVREGAGGMIEDGIWER